MDSLGYIITEIVKYVPSLTFDKSFLLLTIDNNRCIGVVFIIGVG